MPRTWCSSTPSSANGVSAKAISGTPCPTEPAAIFGPMDPDPTIEGHAVSDRGLRSPTGSDTSLSRWGDRKRAQSGHLVIRLGRGRCGGGQPRVHGDAAVVPRRDPYYWTQQFGLDVKISGEVPENQAPRLLAGDVRHRSALLQWAIDDRPVAAVALNHRLPVIKLKKLGAWATAAV